MVEHKDHPWMGVFAATLCPFHEGEEVDEDCLRSYIAGLAAVDSMKGLVCNGHTGERRVLQPGLPPPRAPDAARRSPTSAGRTEGHRTEHVAID